VLAAVTGMCNMLSYVTYQGVAEMPKAAMSRLDRKNFIVDGRKVRKLRSVLGASSESEAIRVAVDRTLDAASAIVALERLRKRGTLGRNLGS
jgi:hypothetical protein